jgi:hypothetical protein
MPILQHQLLASRSPVPNPVVPWSNALNRAYIRLDNITLFKIIQFLVLYCTVLVVSLIKNHQSNMSTTLVKNIICTDVNSVHPEQPQIQIHRLCL